MTIGKLLVGVATGATLLAISGVSASAAVVCSGRTCWHATERHTYPRESRVMVHPDNWRWRAHERYQWREHTGRGYWRNRVWVEF